MNVSAEGTPDTRQRLLYAAVIAFADKGFIGASIREIAQRAQANSALVNYYFGGKEGLYEAALGFLFDHPDNAVHGLPTPPQPGDPDAFARAVAHLDTYIRSFLAEVCGVGTKHICITEEFHRAAHLFWTRELMDPAPERMPLIQKHIQPYVDHVQACIRVLRPDLDLEGTQLMTCSINAQIVFHHMHRTTIAAFRGKPYGPEDLDHVADHITRFSLRGLGIADALPDRSSR